MNARSLLISLILFSAGACTRNSANAAGGTVEDLNARDFKARAEQLKGLYLDVRTPDEVARGRIPGASVIDINDSRFKQKLQLMQKDRPVFVYCASGRRSSNAASVMNDLGFTRVFNLSGGIGAWSREGLPVEREAAPPTSAAPALQPAEFDALLKSEKRVLVDFQTAWCTPCRQMSPIVDALATDWQGKARVMKVDIDVSEALAAREKIQGVPVFVLYVDGQERWRHSGELSREALETELARP